MTVPGSFDSLIAKIIITGADRSQALERSRRALKELVIEGMPTVVPFHRAVLEDPAYTAEDGRFGVHTRWIETEFTARSRHTPAGPTRLPSQPGAPRSWSRSTASGWRSWCQQAWVPPTDPPACASQEAGQAPKRQQGPRPCLAMR